MEREGLSRRRLRVLVGAAVAVVVLAAAGVIAYRVLAPAEELNRTPVSYPGPVEAPQKYIGSFSAAPLIVDGRVRVYADTRQVRADVPASAHTQRSPFWSYRRWPEQLVGVVAVDTTVVSRWSDGKLVAIDARTGQIAWRASAPAEPKSYPGRLDGAAVLYEPTGLFSARAADGHGVIVVTVGGLITAYDSVTGRRLWQVTRPGESGTCLTSGFTAPGDYVAVDSCAEGSELLRYDLLTGKELAPWRPAGQDAEWDVTPLACVVGRSQCRAMRTLDGTRSRGWLLDDDPGGGDPVAAPPLDPQSSWLVDETVVVGQSARPTELIGRSLRTNQELWRWTATSAKTPAVLVLGQPGAVHVLTANHHLITLDPADGVELSSFKMNGWRERNNWQVGFAYAEDRYVVVERLVRRAKADDPDDRYYFGNQPVLLSGS